MMHDAVRIEVAPLSLTQAWDDVEPVTYCKVYSDFLKRLFCHRITSTVLAVLVLFPVSLWIAGSCGRSQQEILGISEERIPVAKVLLGVTGALVAAVVVLTPLVVCLYPPGNFVHMEIRAERENFGLIESYLRSSGKCGVELSRQISGIMAGYGGEICIFICSLIRRCARYDKPLMYFAEDTPADINYLPLQLLSFEQKYETLFTLFDTGMREQCAYFFCVLDDDRDENNFLPLKIHKKSSHTLTVHDSERCYEISLFPPPPADPEDGGAVVQGAGQNALLEMV